MIFGTFVNVSSTQEKLKRRDAEIFLDKNIKRLISPVKLPDLSDIFNNFSLRLRVSALKIPYTELRFIKRDFRWRRKV